MSSVDVVLDWEGALLEVGTLHRYSRRGREAVTFEYHRAWLHEPLRFAIDPALPLVEGPFSPPLGREMFGTIGDSAPDTWGRQLIRRRERRRAAREGRAPRTLFEADFLLSVSDETRLGALRFRHSGQAVFQAPTEAGVPPLLALGGLLNASERILRGEESDEDLRLIFAPGSSLGGARPKASVLSPNGRLCIAKFPKESDEYSMERWEGIALRLASAAGIRTPQHEVVTVRDKPVLLSTRFDREGPNRIPFLSAMSMTSHQDGDRGSYLELVDALAEHGATAKADRTELFRRLVFNVLISNVDDHLRNHGFLRRSRDGWTLSPAYDLNPTPQDVRPRVLTTAIDFDDGTCSLELVREVAEAFGLRLATADGVIGEVAEACSRWRDVARRAGAPPKEIRRMESAFEHRDLEQARLLGDRN